MFRRRDFFQGRALYGAEVKDVSWFKPDGAEMTTEAWEHEHARALAVYLAGEALTETDRRGRRLTDDNFLLLFNADAQPVEFRLPQRLGPGAWMVLLDTSHERGLQADGTFETGSVYTAPPRSLALLLHLKATA